MRIIFLDAVQNFGGSQKSTLNLIKNLEEKHSILYIDFWGVDSVLLENLNNNNIKYEILDKRDNPIVIKSMGNFIRLIKNMKDFIFNFFILKKQLNKICVDFNPDLIIVNNIKSLSIIPNRKSFKVVLFERTWFASQKITKIKKYFFGKVDYFFAVSNATKYAIYAKGLANLDEIYTLPNSISLEKAYKQLAVPISKLKILNCGGYLRTKGLHHTLYIAKELKNKRLDFQVDIVGSLYLGQHSMTYFKELQEYIKQNNLEENVFLHQNIKNMDSFYENANILIHPTYSEGLPRVIMEAMANSIPVISNSVGGVNDYILDGFTGFLADFNNIDKFLDKILLLKSDLEIYNFITKNAYNLIRTSYSNEVQKNNIDNIFKQLG